jgi:hypothetical protein
MTIEILIILRPEHRNDASRVAASVARRLRLRDVEERSGILRGTMSEASFSNLPDLPEARVVEARRLWVGPAPEARSRTESPDASAVTADER